MVETQESEIEEGGPIYLEDVYSMNPEQFNVEQVIAREQEHLCYTLGGELRKTPEPSQDPRGAWAAWEPKKESEPKITLPSDLNGPASSELMSSVRDRINLLKKLDS